MKAEALRGVESVNIFRNETLAGSLTRTDRGAVFEYDAAFFEAHRSEKGGLATHLPYAQKRIACEGVNLHPYFAGLIPEGLRLRTLEARTKTSPDDLFTLMLAAGSDCVGNLFPRLPKAKAHPLDAGVEEATPIDRISFREVFAASIDSHTEPAIPGVQEKLSPSVISFPFATAGKRWILKLDPANKPGLVVNEHFFMEMAATCGLPVAKTRLVRDRNGAPGLLVERFDRERVGRTWRGIRQEDACQLLNRYPADKYNLTTNDIAQALGLCAAPVAERMRLIQLVAFSYLVGNGDLHGKNVSVNEARGALQLSPAYDLLSTRPYRDLKLALKIDGRDDNLTRKQLLEFGTRFDVPARAIENTLAQLTTAAAPFIPRVKELGCDARTTKQLVDLMKKRTADLKKKS